MPEKFRLSGVADLRHMFGDDSSAQQQHRIMQHELNDFE
jgi:hypothetical protein